MNEFKTWNLECFRSYFSPKGAKRGLVLAAVAAFMWSSWAVGYMCGVTEVAATSVVWIFN